MKCTNEQLAELRKYHHHNAEIAPLWLLCASKLCMQPSATAREDPELTQRWRNAQLAMSDTQWRLALEIWRRADEYPFPDAHNGWSSSSVEMHEWRYNKYIFSRTKRIKYI